MARGDLVLFEEFALTIGLERFQLETDTIKCALIKIAATPAASTATPKYSTWSANEVSGSNYTAGGATIASNAYTEADGDAKFDGGNVTWTQHASGFAVGASTGAAWGIIYSDTATSKSAIGFVELKSGSTTVGNVAGDLTISWHASGIFTLSV
jgi:hypothetical protein